MSEVNYRVSVRLMTYNHEAYIAKALQSVLEQKTDFFVEVVVGDDFSTDNTLKVLEQFASTEKIHIKLLKRKEGDSYWKNRQKLGRLYNFANIIENCQGEYVALLDGDDSWGDCTKLQKQVDFLDLNSDCVISFHDVTVINEKGKLIKVGRIKNEKHYRTQEELIGGAHLPTTTVVFRNIIKSFPLEFFQVKNGDSFLWAMLGHEGKAYRHFEIGNAYYRIHSQGVWSGVSTFEKLQEKKNTFQRILKVTDNKFKVVVFKKLLSINWNLIKQTGFKFSQFNNSLNVLRYSFAFLKAKMTNA